MVLVRSMVGARAVSAIAKRQLSTASGSIFADIPMGPPDPILGLTEAFRKDPDPSKILLGAGTYRTDEGKPYLLPSVVEAEKKLLTSGAFKEYAPIHGLQDFLDLSLKFAYGDSCAPLNEDRVASVQTLSGTGACRLVGEFYARFLGKNHPIFLPNPTWGNHIPIMRNAGLEVHRYAYYDPKTRGLDLDGFIRDIRQAPKSSIFLLHACAHNPTGVDPTLEQWREISAEMLAKKHVVFFDCAYQGFASGNADVDAAAVRLFVEQGHQIALGQSFAKNFGLYGERVGALSFVCEDPEESKRVLSQLKLIIRPMYSNPPIHGAMIVKNILSDDKLRNQWYQECAGMANRIISMRSLLRTSLENAGSSHSWQHITDQIGMFCFTGLSSEQVDTMREKYHIYMTQDGRISMAGVNSSNVSYIADSIHAVTR